MNMKKTGLLKRTGALAVALALILSSLLVGFRTDDASDVQVSRVAAIVAGMSMDEKVSQLIVPAIRKWDDEKVQDLDKFPETAKALRNHQYGGVILYGDNIDSSEQTAKLVYDLQKNNSQTDASVHIPYLMPIDEEGGAVLRFSMGTRMNGSMAIGATGKNAKKNAYATGKVLGEEIAALGFNADFAPDIDVNNNPSNPVIGVRSFSDDPELVSGLGISYSDGLNDSGVISTYKHYPGHGDTGTDTHTSLTSVDKTLDELKKNEFIPFEKAVDAGADMIMTAHIMFPKVDDTHTYADGTTGCYPATMSHKMITEILRDEMGFQGVVVTDALEMAGIADANFVEGEKGSVECKANIAKEILNAGVDILLLPLDITNDDAVKDYDDYITAIITKVEAGEIPVERIDESVTRVLSMKEKYGILDYDPNIDLDTIISNAKAVVGSDAHHAEEMKIAKEAVTLVKNKNKALPIKNGNIVFATRDKSGRYCDLPAVKYVISELKSKGLIADDVYVNDLINGEKTGDPGSALRITIGYYYNNENYQELENAVSQADTVIIAHMMTGKAGEAQLYAGNEGYIRTSALLEAASKANARKILLSRHLPYDIARYTDADAVVLSYLSTGTDTDPTARNTQTNNISAYNANIIAAIEPMFGYGDYTGTLPVDIPEIEELSDGQIQYLDKILYNRGSGISVLAKNPLKVKVTSKTYYKKKLNKKKAFSIGVSKAVGKVTYTRDKKASKAGIKVSKKGKVTIPSKCKKGTYKITVKAAGNSRYKSGKKTVTIRIK